MCVAALAWSAHPRWLAVLASNRDEFLGRAALPLHAWTTPGGAAIHAGRDAQAGGTWLAVAPTRLALVTNLRTPEPTPSGVPSRGALPLAAIDGAPLPAARNWNLLTADWAQGRVWRHSSVWAAPQALGAGGIVTVSNGVPGRPWPKERRLAGFVQTALAAPDVGTLTQRLLLALDDRLRPPEPSWPVTGLPREAEGWLSPIHVLAPGGAYRTRVSTVVVVERLPGGSQRLHITERRWDGGSPQDGQVVC